MTYMIAVIISIISIRADMLINTIFNIYLIVSTSKYTIHVELFNIIWLAVRSIRKETVDSCLNQWIGLTVLMKKLRI